jgi:hypothetical protein
MTTELDGHRRYHNAPEAGALTLLEHERVEAACTAWRSLKETIKRTFESWITIGQGLQTLRQKADQLGGRNTFDRLRHQAGLGEIDKATVSRLLHIVQRCSEVSQWRDQLSEQQQVNWASPSAIFKHCPVLAKPKHTQNSMSPMAQLRQANVALQEEIFQLRRAGDDLFSSRDSATDIARLICDRLLQRLSPDKVRRVVEELPKIVAERAALSRDAMGIKGPRTKTARHATDAEAASQ